MRFGLDYDDTFTAAPDLWRRIIDLMIESGHEVIIVTARFPDFGNKEEISEATGLSKGKIFCTSHSPKKWYMHTSYPDFMPDVWIDDNPNAIINGV
jgi:hypothetical protein